MSTILARSPVPTAVFCANDDLAVGALLEARAHGLYVPADTSITGFDDLERASHIEPGLTTIGVPADRIGREVARFVAQRLDARIPACPARLDAKRIVRGSTAARRQIRSKDVSGNRA